MKYLILRGFESTPLYGAVGSAVPRPARCRWIHNLGLFPILGMSLNISNCLESLNAQLGQFTDKMDHWRTPDQKQRWVASALLLIEPSLRRIKEGYRHLPQLRAALQATIGKAERVEGTRIA